MGLIFNGNGDVIKAVDGSLTVEGLDLGGSTNINAGIGTFSGNLNVGGVLTYEDVKNVDSVGIVTARAGVRVTGGDILLTGGDGRKISFANDGSSHYFKMDNSFNGPVINGYGGIKFETNGTNERLRIDSDGQIGIGNITPDTWSTGKSITIGTSQATLFGVSDQVNLSGNAYFNSSWKAAATKAGASQIQQALGNIDFKVSGSVTADAAITWIDALRITSAGLVGIGSAIPAEKLDVAGHIKLDSGPVLENSSSDSILRITSPTGYVEVGPKNTSYSHFLTDRARFYFNKKIIVDTGIISSYNEDLVLATNTGNDERLRITTAGKVGIGTNNPLGDMLTVCEFNSGTGIADNIALRLQGSSGQNVALQFTDTDGAAAYVAVQGDALRLGTNNAERLRIASTGNVSIGTQNVTEGKLQVAGDITAGYHHGSGMYGLLAKRKFDGSNALGGYAIRYASGYESPWIVGYNAGSSFDNQITFGSMTTSDRSLETGVTKRMVIDMETGFVGINTASPRAVLDVEGNAENATLMLHSNDANANLQFSDNTGGARILNYGGDLAFRTGTNAHAFGTGDNERLRIASDGKTTITDAELAVTSTAAYTTHLNYQNGGTNYITSANGGGTYFRGSNNGITGMVILGSGQVDIESKIRHIGDTDTLMEFGTDTITFDTAGTERLRITSDGKVGITSTAPTGALDVRTGTHGFDGFIKLTKDNNFNPSIEYYRTTGSGPNWYGAQLRLMTGDFTYSYAGSATLGNHSYSEIVRITQHGKVGIGIDNPDQKLHLYESSTSSQCYLHIQNNRSRNAAVKFTTTQGSWYVGQGIGVDADRFSVYDSAERFTINSSGDAEVTTGYLQAQDLKLGLLADRFPIIQRAVASSGSQSLSITGGSGYSEHTGSSHTPTDAKQGALISLSAGNPTSDTFGGGIKYYANGHTSPNNPGSGNQHVFYTRSGANTYAERIRIEESGKILINTPGTSINAHEQSDDVVIGNVSHGHDTGATIVSNPNYNGWIAFSDGTTNSTRRRGAIVYHHPSDTMYLRTNNNQTALQISSDGEVTKPRNPAFSVRHSVNQSVTSTGWTQKTFNTEIFDIGGNFASNAFTAPVDGIYSFGWNQRFDAGNGQYFRVVLRVNDSTGSQYQHGHAIYRDDDGFHYITLNLTSLLQLDAGDVVKAFAYSHTDNSYTLQNESVFWGYLVS